MTTLKSILEDTLVAPILKLRETHSDHYFTKSGYNILIENADSAIKKLILEKIGEDSECKTPLLVTRDMAIDAGDPALEGTVFGGCGTCAECIRNQAKAEIRKAVEQC